MNPKIQAAALLGILTAADARMPAGHAYALVMTHGVSHQVFESISGMLVRGGFITRAPSHLLGITAKGREALKALDGALSGTG